MKLPSDFSVKHVGSLVTDLAAISCLGAGLAAVVLSLIPGKRLTGKTEGVDPSSFIDPGAGETARYRLAYKDLVTVKNTSLDATQVSQANSAPAVDETNLDVTRAQSASDLALTMFDLGVLGAGLAERSQAATKQMTKTKVEKTRVEPKKNEAKKAESKTRVEPKPKADAKGKGSDLKKEKGSQKAGFQTSMAVRKITYGPKATKETSLPGAAESSIEGLAEEFSQSAKPALAADDTEQFAQEKQPLFGESDVTEFQSLPDEEGSEPAAPPIILDPKKDPKKVGRATLIEPKSNLQGGQQPPSDDREPPPLEYFK